PGRSCRRLGHRSPCRSRPGRRRHRCRPSSKTEKTRMETQMNVQVAVNGYGVIGKRVADAVRDMPDMDLVGVADIATDWHVRTAAGLGIAVFAATQETRAAMRGAGVPVAGTLDELLARADVVVDTTPKRVAATNLEVYRSAGVKAVFQGGE